MTRNPDSAIALYEVASAHVSFVNPTEIRWQQSRKASDFTETELLREAAWVILCSGFRETIVRQKFDYISLCFCDWESAALIMSAPGACRKAALASIGNTRKMDAIIEVARSINAVGFGTVKQRILADPIEELQDFPYIGPVTVWHLAKNLGFKVAKPDRHLVRLCRMFGYSDVTEFCDVIARATGETIDVVDTILWRYCATKRIFA